MDVVSFHARSRKAYCSRVDGRPAVCIPCSAVDPRATACKSATEVTACMSGLKPSGALCVCSANGQAPAPAGNVNDFTCPLDCTRFGSGVASCNNNQVTACNRGYQASSNLDACTPCPALAPGATECAAGRVTACAAGLKVAFSDNKYSCVCGDPASYPLVGPDGELSKEGEKDHELTTILR